MVSDKYTYKPKEISYGEAIERLDGSIAPGELALVQRTDRMIIYDCDWVGGAYVNVTDNNGGVKIEIDGNADGFPGVEGFLVKVLKINLEGADE